MLRRMLSRAYRRARAAEGAGDYRGAATLYAEVGATDEAARALLFHASKATSFEDRVDAYRDALRWLPVGHSQRVEVEGALATAIVEEAQRRGSLGPDEQARLVTAAQVLERIERYAGAATAWELLGRLDEATRCLERAGEVERLERVLERQATTETADRRLQGLLRDYEAAMIGGARALAADALDQAQKISPGDRTVAELAERLRERWPPHGKVLLDIGGERVLFLGNHPFVIGRGDDADVSLRGVGVSRRHTEIEVTPNGVVVRDLGSRNGTLVSGVAVAGEITLSHASPIGIGHDLRLHLEVLGGSSDPLRGVEAPGRQGDATKGSPAVARGEATPQARMDRRPEMDGYFRRAPLEPASRGVLLKVTAGLDAGLTIIGGPAPLRWSSLACVIDFPRGRARISPDARVPVALNDRPLVTEIILLVGDRMQVGEDRLRVCSL